MEDTNSGSSLSSSSVTRIKIRHTDRDSLLERGKKEMGRIHKVCLDKVDATRNT